MSITAEIDVSQIASLAKAIKGVKTNLPKEIAKAINATAKSAKSNPKTKIGISEKIRAEIVIKTRDLHPLIKTGKATPQNLTSSVSLGKTKRPSMRMFSPKHTGAGVTYRISKKGGRKLIPGAFMGPKPGVLAPKLYGGVYKRTGGAKTKASKGRYAGKMREPIMKLMGPSPWGVVVKNDIKTKQIADIEADLKKRMDRQIRENLLRASGVIPPRR